MKKKFLWTSVVIGFCILLLIVGGVLKNNLNKNIASDKNVSNKTAAANKSDKNANNTLNESNNTANTEENSAANNAASNTAAQSTNTAVSNSGNSSTANSTKATAGTANTAAQKQTSGSTQSNINTSPAPVNPMPVSQGTGQQGGSSPGNQPAVPQPNFEIKNGLGGNYIVSPKHIDFAGNTVADVTLAALRDAHISKETTGSGSTLYFQSIDGLKEKVNGPNSGWLYYVNGSTPNESCGAYTLKAGDTVKWVYSSN